MNQRFEEKVRSMTRKEIVMSVVNGLLAEHVQVDMLNFGNVENGVCFGCAATNAVCEITGVKFKTENILTQKLRSAFVKANQTFLSAFEDAIDYLRKGNVRAYNHWAEQIGMAILPDADLPYLSTSNWREKIHLYKAYADTL